MNTDAQPVVAAFDFDRTLTTKDTVFPFMLKVAGIAPLIRILIAKAPTICALVVRRRRDDLKELMCREVFRARRCEEVDEVGVAHAAKIVDRLMRTDTTKRLRWHQQQGDVVVLVSASLAPYLHAVGDLLEVDAVVCTELESVDGLYTGALVGNNCRGAEKWTRLAQWLSDSGLDQSAVGYAYGDSAGDHALLAHSQIPVWVGRREVQPCPF